MEYQQFALYCQMNYNAQRRQHALIHGDDEAIKRGLQEVALRRRQTARLARAAALDRVLGSLRSALRTLRRQPRIVA
jgi:hypothetical protein